VVDVRGTKLLPFLATLLFLSSCYSGGATDYTLYYQAVRQSLAGGGQAHVSKSEASAIPYASIGYRLNDGPEQLLVLATQTGSDQLWTSASHVVLETRAGHIVRTVGLPNDVGSVTSQYKQGDTAIPTESNVRVGTRLEDLPNLGIYGAPVVCTASPQGVQTIAILGRGITTKKVDEVCRSDSLNWSFTDNYWIDTENGLVWRSIQNLSPKGEKVEVEVLRPPA